MDLSQDTVHRIWKLVADYRVGIFTLYLPPRYEDSLGFAHGRCRGVETNWLLTDHVQVVELPGPGGGTGREFWIPVHGGIEAMRQAVRGE